MKAGGAVLDHLRGEEQENTMTSDGITFLNNFT